MARAVRFALRHSKLVIGAWIAVIAVCASFGLAAGNAFKPPNLIASDTGTGHWFELTTESDFGINTSVLLTGPKPQLRKQGAALAAELRDVPNIRVLSPFDKPAQGAGQPRSPFTKQSGNSALFLVDSVLEDGQDAAEAVPVVREVIAATVHPPVTSRVTGAPAVAKGLGDESYAATQRSERIAAPILMLVLLLIFRSPVAAAIPGIMGMGTVLASKGIVETLAGLTPVDQMALNLSSMMGLALGVDYSLLMVSRYREHRRENPGAVAENIALASRATGRTIASAAVLVVAVMTTAMLLSIGPIFTSAALGVGVATVFGALTAIFVAPALLLVLDPWLERWRVPSLRKGPRSSRFARRQPIAVPIVALIALLALAAPTLGIEPGAPDVKLLPKETQARTDYEQIGKQVGPGFGAVFDIAVHSRDGYPLTKPRSLAAISRLQREITADPGVATVIGPAAIAGMTKGLNGLQQSLAAQQKGTARLGRGLDRAADGSRRAGDGAGRLHAATGAAERGAARLAAGLDAAAGGSETLVGGIDATSGGGARLATGSRRASSGADQLSSALKKASASSGAMSSNARVLANDLRTGSDQLAALDGPLTTAEQRLDAAWKSLQSMTSGRADPEYQAALAAVTDATIAITGIDPATGARPDAGYSGVAAGIDDADGQFSLGLYLSDRMRSQGQKTRRGVQKLARGAARLDDGLDQVEAGSAKLSGVLEQLAIASQRLPGGLDELSDGAGQLAAGLGQVDSGSGQLAAGIGGSQSPGQLTSGLERMRAALTRQQGGTPLGKLTANSPGFFRNGGIPLAAVNGATRPNRDRARFVLDLTNGGQTARILAIPAYATNDDRMGALHDRITDLTREVGADRLEVAVGGPAAALQDFKEQIAPRLPFIVGAFALISLLMLVFVVRAVPLAAICVLLNLLTVGVAFGTMQLTFGSADPLLGGPGYVDLIVLFGSLAIVFALSIDYQVFLLARIREEYDESHDNERAVTAAIGRTAGVITGAAAVMVAVFSAFVTSTHVGLRELGVGLAVAVFLDATVVRLILLPAAMRLVGDRVWWFPAWLDRRLPSLSL